MVLSLKRSLMVVLLAGIISCAFLMGQKLGAGSSRPLHDLGHILSAGKDSNGPFGAANLVGRTQDPNVAPADIFETVLDHVKRDFVEPTGGDAHLSNGALTQMLASLDDSKTSFLDPDNRKARQSALEGKFYGVGAVLTVTQKKEGDIAYHDVTVVDVMPGSAAEKAGLKSNDHITEIDGHWIIGHSIYGDLDRIRKETNKDDAAKRAELEPIAQRFKAGYTIPKALVKLQQGEGKSYKLTVERAGQATPLKVDVTTALVQVDPVEYKTVGDHVGYLRIRQFNNKATQEFEAALDRIAAATDTKGLIVDLRQNPGGVTAESATGVDGYTSARALLAHLTPGGKVATIARKPDANEALTIEPANSQVHLPLIVLVDAGTANLSEMVAVALRDAGKAKLVGTHTFGDDVLQLFAPLKNGSGIEMTTAHLLTAAGVDLNKGVDPDIRIDAGAGGTDAALDRAIAAVSQGA